MFGHSGRNTSPNFFRDDQETFIRSWWFATVMVMKVAKARQAMDEVTGLAYFRDSGMFDEQKDLQEFYELLAYVSCVVLDRLRDDIERTHGWTDETHDLHIGYMVSLGMALDQVFSLRSDSERVFVDLLQDYYWPKYGEEFDEFWGLGDEDEGKTLDELNEELSESISTLLSGDSDDEHYNTHCYYAFRIGHIYDVVDPAKVIENAQPYCDLVMQLYAPAFLELPVDKLKADLSELYSSTDDGE